MPLAACLTRSSTVRTVAARLSQKAGGRRHTMQFGIFYIVQWHESRTQLIGAVI